MVCVFLPGTLFQSSAHFGTFSGVPGFLDHASLVLGKNPEKPEHHYGLCHTLLTISYKEKEKIIERPPTTGKQTWEKKVCLRLEKCAGVRRYTDLRLKTTKTKCAA